MYAVEGVQSLQIVSDYSGSFQAAAFIFDLGKPPKPFPPFCTVLHPEILCELRKRALNLEHGS